MTVRFSLSHLPEYYSVIAGGVVGIVDPVSSHPQCNWKGLYLSTALVTFPLVPPPPHQNEPSGCPNGITPGQDITIIHGIITSSLSAF